MIIAVDFDKTLSLGNWPDVGPANMPVIEALLERKKRGDKIILWTCRGGDELSAAVAWCKIYGLEFDAVNANLPDVLDSWGFKDTRKVFAHEYWDDGAVPIERVTDADETMTERELRAAATGIIVYNYIMEHGSPLEPNEDGFVEMVGCLSDEAMEQTLEFCSYLSPNVTELEWFDDVDEDGEDVGE